MFYQISDGQKSHPSLYKYILKNLFEDQNRKSCISNLEMKDETVLVTYYICWFNSHEITLDEDIKIRSSNKHYLRPDKCNDLRPSIVKKTYTLEDINYDIPFWQNMWECYYYLFTVYKSRLKSANYIFWVT